MKNVAGMSRRLSVAFVQGAGCGLGIDLISPFLYTPILAKLSGLLTIAASYPTPAKGEWARSHPRLSNTTTVLGFAMGMTFGYECGEKILKAVFLEKSEPAIPSIPAVSEPGIMVYKDGLPFKIVVSGYDLT